MAGTSDFLKTIMRVVMALLWALASSSCSYHPPFSLDFCQFFDELPFTPVSGDPPAAVFEDVGTIKVMHGSGSAKLDKGDFIKVEQNAVIPAYANQAAVFLNGWQLDYTSDDHHVLGLGTIIARIRVTPGKVTWNALADLRDNEPDDPYQWTYHYTIIAWNDANLHAFVDQTDSDVFCRSHQPHGADNFFVTDNEFRTTTALSCYASFLENPNFSSGRSVAVMPRGFALSWFSDHHLLQLAYNLESSGQPFIEDRDYQKATKTLHPLSAPPDGRVGDGFVSWNSCSILKDDSGRRDVGFGEMVSAMGGSDVGVIEPPFFILPRAQPGGASLGLPGGSFVKTQEVLVDNVPYAYAVPMLTGWDIGYDPIHGDQHVKHIGIWLDGFQWPLNDPQRALRYTVSSIVQDKDNQPANYFHAKVTILGLRHL